MSPILIYYISFMRLFFNLNVLYFLSGHMVSLTLSGCKEKKHPNDLGLSKECPAALLQWLLTLSLNSLQPTSLHLGHFSLLTFQVRGVGAGDWDGCSQRSQARSTHCCGFPSTLLTQPSSFCYLTVFTRHLQQERCT